MTFRKILSAIFRPFIVFECWLSRLWVSAAHKRLMFLDWSFTSSTPEFFDHHIDLYYQWLETGNSLWLERGAFGSLALKGGNLLELACGDGFNTKNFYALRSRSVTACDFDKSALKIAISKNSAENIKYILSDIRAEIPGSGMTFDNVVWDAAIEHFTEIEIDSIMSTIKQRLTKDGILSGYTIVENNGGIKQLHQHEYEFKNKEDLLRFLKPYFKNIKIFETKYPTRHNLYFWASDSVLPFDQSWPLMLVSS